jgi:hypothetical protein
MELTPSEKEIDFLLSKLKEIAEAVDSAATDLIKYNNTCKSRFMSLENDSIISEAYKKLGSAVWKYKVQIYKTRYSIPSRLVPLPQPIQEIQNEQN